MGKVFRVNMKTLRLAFTLVLLSLEWNKACGKVSSCLHCFSGPGHEDPECAEGTGKDFDGCYVAANENRSGGTGSAAAASGTRQRRRPSARRSTKKLASDALTSLGVTPTTATRWTQDELQELLNV